MDLNTLLKKTEAKSAKIKTSRRPPSIAVEDRPYSNDLQNEIKAVNLSVTEPRTNLGQSSDKIKTNLGQSSDKIKTNLGQSSVEISESSDKVRTQPRTGSRTKLGQSSDKVRTKESFSTLVGLQRKITIFLYQCCQFVRDKITEPLTIEHIALSCETTIPSAQKTIQRLEKKAIIIRAKFRTGRGGWTQYELAYDIFQELLHLETQDKLRTNLGQSSDKVRTQPRTQPRTSDPSSSSFLSSSSELKELTTIEVEQVSDKSDLPLEWQEIDFVDLVKLEVHFSRTHLKQWHDRNYCTAKEAQESIWHFAYFMTYSPKEKIPKTPLSYLMGIMAKSHYFSRPDGYISPEEEGLKRRNDDMRRKSESMKRLQEENFALSFDVWFNSLTGSEVNALTPTLSDLEAKRVALQEKFRDLHFMTIRDNPGIDVTKLKLKAPSELEVQNQSEIEALQRQIKDCEAILERHPRDGDTRAKLQKCNMTLLALRMGEGLTAQGVRAIADAELGPLNS